MVSFGCISNCRSVRERRDGARTVSTWRYHRRTNDCAPLGLTILRFISIDMNVLRTSEHSPLGGYISIENDTGILQNLVEVSGFGFQVSV
jgi:hypothetical protein